MLCRVINDGCAFEYVYFIMVTFFLYLSCWMQNVEPWFVVMVGDYSWVFEGCVVMKCFFTFRKFRESLRVLDAREFH